MIARIIIVVQDIGIATFLMLLWRDTYGPETIPLDPAPTAAQNTPKAQAPVAPTDAEPWRRWPRPPGGFVDLGCGNGLLTHILISEGYTGYGFDLRARTSWTHYPQATQSHLLVRALDPTTPTKDPPMKHGQPNRRDPASSSQPPDTGNNDDNEEEEANGTTCNGGSHGCVEDPAEDLLLPTGCFLIGNHADELTPWIPPLATRHHASGYLSIPCCAWSFDARFDRSRDVPFCAVDTESLNLGAEGAAGSSYALYRVWLAALSVHCGWAVEVEMLRIPSTRNWAIVGEFESSPPSLLRVS
jgi:tRNASer (uridine44-2'-O)-methyltransferase